MYVHVRVVPGVKKEKILKKTETEYEIRVREPAERNLANGRIREILAQEFSVSLSAVRLLTGHRSPSKMYTIEVGGLSR
jgi:uncharacterized protein YggU (UPF0235/DUF167 family)